MESLTTAFSLRYVFVTDKPAWSANSIPSGAWWYHARLVDVNPPPLKPLHI